jgi:hypothetical protein
MATRYIDKETGATTSTAIANDTAGTRKIKDLPDALGVVFDKVDKTFKYNDTGTIRSFGAINQTAVATLAAVNTLTAADSGKTLILSSGTEFATTLPALASGLNFTFIVGAAPSGASYTILSAGGADVIHGVAVSAADAGGSVDTTAGTAADTITFVDGQAQIGDRISLVCDGTFWYASGVCSDEDAITFTAT